MTHLSLSLFGKWRAEHSEIGALAFRGSKATALIAYLASEPGDHARDVLATLFWGELSTEQARNNLRVTLSQIKKALPPPFNTTAIHSNRRSVSWQPSEAIRLDTTCFKAALEPCRHANSTAVPCATCLKNIERAVDLYQGEFLTGYYLPDCLAFDEWLFVNRERFHIQAMTLLDTLTEALCQNEDWQKAERYTRQQLALDPLRELSYRRLMRILAQQEERNELIKVYQRCKQLLHGDLGIEPETATTQLYQELLEQPQNLKNQTAVSLPRSASAAHNTLPQVMTPFFGREDQIAELTAQIKQGDYRLFTIEGLGGIGKTRFSIEVGKQLLSQFKDGVHFVSLVAVTDHARIPATIAAALNIQITASQTPELVQLQLALQSRQLLLILDNFERLTAGYEIVLALLEQVPNLTILLTSRVRLAVTAESVFSLGGLAVPSAEASLAEAQKQPAVRLLVDRTFRLDKRFRLTADTLAAVIQICRQLEGMPLGLELVATWIPEIGLDQVLQEIGERGDQLEALAPDMPQRHSSMAAVFDYSWVLLEPHEQQLLAQLSLFQGDFSRQAAAKIVGASLIQLTHLRYKSLLRLGDNGRYEIHPLIQQFVRQKFDGVINDPSAVKQTFAAYFLSWIDQFPAQLHGATPRQAAAEMGIEIYNVRAAWRWAVEAGNWPAVIKAAFDLEAYYQVTGELNEQQQDLTLAINHLSDPSSEHLPQLKLVLAESYQTQSNLPALAEELNQFEQLISVADGYPQLRLALLQAEHEKMQGHLPDAIAHLKKALELAEDSAHAHLRARILYLLAYTHLQIESLDQAEAYAHQGLALSRRINNSGNEQRMTFAMGIIQLDRRQYPAAAKFFADAYAMRQQTGNRRNEANAINALAQTLSLMWQLEQSIPHFNEAAQIGREIGYVAQLADVEQNFSSTFRRLDQLDLAIEHGHNAARLTRQHNLKDAWGTSSVALAHAYLAAGELSKAEQFYKQARDVQQSLGLQHYAIEAGMGLAAVALANRDVTTAVGFINELLDYQKEKGTIRVEDPLEMWGTCYQLMKLTKDDRLDLVTNILKTLWSQMKEGLVDEGERRFEEYCLKRFDVSFLSVG